MLTPEDREHARRAARAAPDPTPQAIARLAAVIRENERSVASAA